MCWYWIFLLMIRRPPRATLTYTRVPYTSLFRSTLKEAGHQPASSSSRAIDRNSSGETRIAAPVGKARTQAGPPAIPLHISHLTAIFLGFSSPNCFLVHLGDGSLGPGPRPCSSQRSRPGLGGGAASKRTAPSGPFAL